MAEEMELIYISINQLLNDICKFLRDDVNAEALSPEAKRQADNLIRRSKVQLQKISTITDSSPDYYMDMQPKKEQVDEEEDIVFVPEGIFSEDTAECPYLGTPARNLPSDEKCGDMYLKTKFIFGFEKLKKIYAGIYGDWLLIYRSEKDSKPCYTYHLKIYKAQMHVACKQSADETKCFCLINKNTQWTCQFLALTHKDMLQWIAKINRCHQTNKIVYPSTSKESISGKANLSSDIAKSESIEDDADVDGETYDVIVINNRKKDEINRAAQSEINEEDAYIDIGPPSRINEQLPPPPPPQIRKLQNNKQQIPLPPVPDQNGDSDDSIDYDFPVVEQHLNNLRPRDSFSEDEEEEQIYDKVMVVTAPQQNKDKIATPNKEEIFTAKSDTLVVPPKKKEIFTAKNDKLVAPPNKEEIFTPKKETVAPPRPVVMPKPSKLKKPTIDVKIIKPSPRGKTSTKEILKLAKENSRQ